MLPTQRAVERCAVDAGLIVEPLARFGHDYARTLKAWRERFEEKWPQVEELGFDNRFCRMWRYYLSYCEAGFSEELIDVQIFKFSRPA